MVLTGGFGTLAPYKRARCIEQCQVGLADGLTRDELRSHNSFIVHAVDILALDPQVLEGIWRPLKIPGLPGSVLVELSDPENSRVAAQYARVIELVSTRAAASFTTGLADAPCGEPGGGPSPAIFLRMSSDACAGGDRVAVAGSCLEYEWELVLGGEWFFRHITVLESLGAVINVALFGLVFTLVQLVHEGDASAEGPMLLGRAKSDDQQALSALMLSLIHI